MVAPRLKPIIFGQAICPQAAAFLARASGLDSKHRRAYISFINGLVSGGVWPKFDLLYVFATQNSTTALLNLVSSSFPCLAAGSPTFAADGGYTGVDASTTVYLDTQFNASSAGGKYAQDSAHVSCVTNTNAMSTAAGGVGIGVYAAGASETDILPQYSDGSAYFRINDGAGSSGIAVANSLGRYVANRSGASATQAYKNGTSIGSPNAASGSLVNSTMRILANSNVLGLGSALQYQMASAGGSLTASDVSIFDAAIVSYQNAIR